jgi:hypothetical protein
MPVLTNIETQAWKTIYITNTCTCTDFDWGTGKMEQTQECYQDGNHDNMHRGYFVRCMEKISGLNKKDADKIYSMYFGGTQKYKAIAELWNNYLIVRIQYEGSTEIKTIEHGY